MPNLRIQVEINKGKRGVPLSKLAQIVSDVQQFLLMMSQDLSLEVRARSWIGVDFENSSLSFVAEKLEPATIHDIEEFNSAFASIAERHPVSALRRSTVAQYAKIADPIEPEEAVSFGLYAPPATIEGDQRQVEFVGSRSATDTEPIRWVALTKNAADEIKAEVQGRVRAYGALQGRIHALFLGSYPSFFHLRELSTGSLVKCIYRNPSVYRSITQSLQVENAVLHVYGYTTTDLVERKLEEMEVDRVDQAATVTDEEFESLFGSQLDFTGTLTTQEFIDNVRGRAH